LQFCRYVPLVAGLGAKVILHVQASLAGVLRDLPGVQSLLVRGETLPAFDYHCPLLSLPLVFKTDLNQIPADVPYLRANAKKISAWHKRLGRPSKPRIGLVWSGSAEPDPLRSVPLQALLAVLPDNFEYISLQKEVWSRDTDALQHSAIRHFADEIHDFSDTAALAMLVDAVITIDTSVAHLVGGLARPTYLLLPYAPDWRWMLHRSDSPWYPTMQLYRQAQDKDWNPVLKQLVDDLQGENHSSFQK